MHIENMKYQWKQVSSTFNPAFAMPVLHGKKRGTGRQEGERERRGRGEGKERGGRGREKER